MLFRTVKIILFAAGLAAVPLHAAETGPPVRGLIDRIAPGHGDDFVLETITATNGENVFAVGARDGKIVLGGDGPLSQAVAFNWYLKHDAHVSVSWYADDAITVPEHLPLPAKTIRRTTPFQKRFFLNYCTFGYSFPWWQWRDWERFIDWMALNGINLPLAQGGTEAIEQQVWRSYGLTDKEIRGDFFTGPAHLPWNRMGNLDGWDGPLPQSYIDGQLALTRRIVARERSFGMKPILPAFAGHVPAALKRVRPETKLTALHWCGVTTHFISPQDPLFREIEVKFLREQARELGTDHYYGTDPFNEMTPPSWDPAYLASVSKTIYDSMAEADPNAVWVQMAWTFQNDGHWTKPRLEAMIKSVPPGRMILLDYFCEHVELWRRNDFFGAPFIWNYLGNFGGNTVVHGPVQLVNQRLTAVMNDASLTNCVGLGSTLEGLNNQSMYEFLLDRAWAGPQCDVTAWLRDQARCRAGGDDADVESAFETFWLKVLAGSGDGSGGDAFTMVPRLAPGSTRGYLGDAKTYPAAPLAAAWKAMLAAGPAARARDAYRADLVTITRLALTTVGDQLRRQMFAARNRKDAASFKKLEAQFLELGGDLNTLLGTRPNLLFGKWVADARAWGQNPAEADYYERNARTIVTTWLGRNNMLNDYAGRDWNGLLQDYYLVRWKMYLDAVGVALEAAVKDDQPVADTDHAVMPKIMDFEWAFANGDGGKFPSQPSGDAFAIAKKLYAKYAADLLNPVPAGTPYWKGATSADFIGRWRYQAEGATWEREFLPDGSVKLYRNGQPQDWSGFTWTFERGTMVLKNAGGKIFERQVLQDVNTMLFPMGGWQPARREANPSGSPAGTPGQK